MFGFQAPVAGFYRYYCMFGIGLRADCFEQFSPSRSSENSLEQSNAVTILRIFRAGGLSTQVSLEIAVIRNKMLRGYFCFVGTHLSLIPHSKCVPMDVTYTTAAQLVGLRSRRSSCRREKAYAKTKLCTVRTNVPKVVRLRCRVSLSFYPTYRLLSDSLACERRYCINVSFSSLIRKLPHDKPYG